MIVVQMLHTVFSVVDTCNVLANNAKIGARTVVWMSS
jgi:hypothetical protein